MLADKGGDRGLRGLQYRAMSSTPRQAAIDVPAGVAGMQRFEHEAMNCTWGLYLADCKRDYADSLAEEVFDEIDRVEIELSRFVEISDVSHINALRAGECVQVGIEALECLEVAACLHAESDGAFDVTFASDVKPPDSASPQHALASDARLCGMNYLHIDRDARTIGVSADGVVVDLGAIGKGYAIDLAVDILRDWSVESALLHSGQSTLYALGSAPGGGDWRIPIRNPSDPARPLGDACFRDAALSGSGTAVKGRHILDPRTGNPAVGTAGAWALTPSAVLSDALSTACFVLEHQSVAALCRLHAETSALLLSAGGALESIGFPIRGG